LVPFWLSTQTSSKKTSFQTKALKYLMLALAHLILLFYATTQLLRRPKCSAVESQNSANWVRLRKKCFMISSKCKHQRRFRRSQLALSILCSCPSQVRSTGVAQTKRDNLGLEQALEWKWDRSKFQRESKFIKSSVEV